MIKDIIKKIEKLFHEKAPPSIKLIGDRLPTKYEIEYGKSLNKSK